MSPVLIAYSLPLRNPSCDDGVAIRKVSPTRIGVECCVTGYAKLGAALIYSPKPEVENWASGNSVPYTQGLAVFLRDHRSS